MNVLWLILAAMAGACLGAVGMAVCAAAGRADDAADDTEETYEPFRTHESDDRAEWLFDKGA